MLGTMRISTVCSIVSLFVITGCTTTLQATAQNKTSLPQKLSVLVAEDPQKPPVMRLEVDVDSNSNPAPVVVGDFKTGSLIILKMSLRTGGVTGRTTLTLPSKPDPYTVNVESRVINAPNLELSDADNIEKQISNISGSYPSPTADIGAFLEQFLGGLYTKHLAGDELKLIREIDPQALQAKVALNTFMPATTPQTEFGVVLTADSSNLGVLKAQLPNVINFKTSLSSSELYKYVFKMNNTAWRASPDTWYTVEKRLRLTAEGRKTLTDITNLLISNQELYYLDGAYVLGNVNMEVHSAQSLEAEAEVNAQNFIHAGGAYKWAKSNGDEKTYKNIVLRVSFYSLKPAVIQTPPSSSLQVGLPNSIIRPLTDMNPNRTEINNTTAILAETPGSKNNLSIIATRAERFDPKLKLIYEVPQRN